MTNHAKQSQSENKRHRKNHPTNFIKKQFFYDLIMDGQASERKTKKYTEPK